jgi:glycosyltransferase involved in cell wall biosynthesis
VTPTSLIVAPAARLPTQVIRVASVPSGHVYVRHLSSLGENDGVTRLPDPRPTGIAAPQQQWWPPAMLDPRWIEENANTFDVFHVHFGFDAMSPQGLDQVVAALRRSGKPLVYTVHDLRNPHHATAGDHDRHLDVLIPQADALITLTDGAARAIQRRWGRRPRVLPHPHVLRLDQLAPRAARDSETFVVGIHCKSVRAGMDPAGVISGLLPLVGELPGLRLRVNAHRDVFDADGARHDPALRALLDEAQETGSAEVEVHDYFSDDLLWTYLRSLDVSVLPYRFGTHSGWLEACYDVGTTVIAPSCGFYREQRPTLGFRHDESGLDAVSLRDAVRSAYDRRPTWQASVAGRRAERSALAAAHRQVYEHVLQ